MHPAPTVHPPCTHRAPQVRTERSAVPFCTLLEADARQREGLDTDAAGCDAGAAGSQGGGGAAAAVAAPTFGWPLELYQVHGSGATLALAPTSEG